MKPILKLFLLCIILWGCKKENDRPQWDIAVLGPLFKATIKVDNLIADSIKNVAPDGAVTVVYNHSIYSIPVDSIFKIPDTTIHSYYYWQSPPTLTFPPGVPFPVNSTPIRLSLSGAELSKSVIKKGFLRVIAKNQLDARVNYSFSIGKALLNGDSLVITRIVNAGTKASPTIFDTLIDMSGYQLDLTGPAKNEFNRIDYTVKSFALDSAHINSDSLYNLYVTFEGLVPVYAKGYLGMNSTTASGSKYVSVSKLIGGGTILLDSMMMRITFQDSVGADAQAMLTSMQSVNTRSGTKIDLNGSAVINHTVNLNRATENGPYPSSITPTSAYFDINQSNSNLLQFVQNLPDSINYAVKFNINPLGNISGHNDFIYTDSLFNANLDLRFPLRFAANQLAFIDTQNVSIDNQASFDHVGPGTFTLIADNGFPWEMDLQIEVLDANNHAIDNILVPGIIAPAPIDASFRAIGKQRSTIAIPVDENRKNEILNAPRIALRAEFTTSAYPQVLQVYSDYSLDLKLIADAKYLIR